MKKEINVLLKEIREDRDITTSEIAAYLNMSQSNYSRIENGRQKLTIDIFIQICEFLKVSPKSFFSDETLSITLTQEDLNKLNIANQALTDFFSKINKELK